MATTFGNLLGTLRNTFSIGKTAIKKTFTNNAGKIELDASLQLDAELGLKEISSPSTPPSLFRRLFAKSDGFLWHKKSDGTEYQLLDSNTELSLSCGVYDMPSYSDNFNGSATIGSGTYCLRTDVSGYGRGAIQKFTVAGATFTMVDETINYIIVRYDVGSASAILERVVDVSFIDEMKTIPVFTIFRSGNTLCFLDWDHLATGTINKIHQRLVKTERFAKDNSVAGLILSDPGSRTISISSGRVWYGATFVDLDNFISSSDMLCFWKHVNGVWVKSIVTQYNNTQYDNGVDLVTLTNNRYATIFVYRSVEIEIRAQYILGSGDYTLLEAQSSNPPLVLPPAIAALGFLVGKIIIEKNSNIPYSVQSYNISPISQSVPVFNHNDTLNRDVAGNHNRLSPNIDATNGIQITNSLGVNILDVDTVNLRVGVGTAVPASKLHVSIGTGSTNNIQITNSVTGESVSDGFHIGVDASGNATLNQKETLPMIFSVSDSEKMRIATNGDLDSVGYNLTQGQRGQRYNGIETITDCEILYSPATRIFTIQPKSPATAFYVWVESKRYTYTTAQTLAAHANTTAVYYFYFNSSGVLTQSTTPWDIMSTAQVAYVMYNSTLVDGFAGEERHGCVMDPATHLYNHINNGAFVVSGFPITGYTLATDTTTATTYLIDAGVIRDEDLQIPVVAQADGSGYTVMYRTGTAGDWTWSASRALPYIISGANNIQYNQLNGSTWQLTDLVGGSANEYFNIYVVATNSLDTRFDVVQILGQAIYTTLATAQAESLSNLSFGGLPFQEIAPLYQITMRRNGGYSTTTGRSRIEAVTKIIGTKFTIQQNTLTGVHNSLSGRSDVSAHPLTSITGTNLGAVPFVGSTGLEEDTAFIFDPSTNTLKSDVLQTESSLLQKHITTPANPASGYLKVYPKSDNKLYKLTSAGVETEIGIANLYHNYNFSSLDDSYREFYGGVWVLVLIGYEIDLANYSIDTKLTIGHYNRDSTYPNGILIDLMYGTNYGSSVTLLNTTLTDTTNIYYGQDLTLNVASVPTTGKAKLRINMLNNSIGYLRSIQHVLIKR